MPAYHLHPMAVHFPIVLLFLGLGTSIVAALAGRPTWLDEATKWLLWLGTAAVWVTVGLGLLAARTAPHVPAAWEVLGEHREFGLWTGAAFTALSLLHRFLRRRRWLLVLAWAAAAGVLVTAAYHGALLVYQFGVGVARGE